MAIKICFSLIPALTELTAKHFIARLMWLRDKLSAKNIQFLMYYIYNTLMVGETVSAIVGVTCVYGILYIFKYMCEATQNNYRLLMEEDAHVGANMTFDNEEQRKQFAVQLRLAELQINSYQSTPPPPEYNSICIISQPSLPIAIESAPEPAPAYVPVSALVPAPVPVSANAPNNQLYGSL